MPKTISLISAQAASLVRERRYAEAIVLLESAVSKYPDLRSFKYTLELCRRRANLSSQQLSDLGEHPTDIIVYICISHNPDNKSADEIVDKICFYLNPINEKVHKVYIFHVDKTSNQQPLLNHNLDQSGHRYLEIFANRLSFISETTFKSHFNDSSFRPSRSILYNFGPSVEHGLSSESIRYTSILKQLNNAWRIHDSVQHHGSFLLRSTLEFFLEDNLKWRVNPLTAMISFLKDRRPGITYVIGTGPSIKYSYKSVERRPNSVVISCNSAIKNSTFMETIQPDIICATDPIFHAGWGQYASEFRSLLVSALAKYNFFLVVPKRDIHIYSAEIPAIYHDRIGFVDFVQSDGFLVDLSVEHRVKSTPNVLTNSMLPLAATLSKTIAILGCDGKKTSTGYFWEHDKASQINEKMSAIQSDFKGFFDINYDKYYSDHCDTLSCLLSSLESTGFNITSITPSWIPALTDRANLDKDIIDVSANRVDLTTVIPCYNAEVFLRRAVESVKSASKSAKVISRVVLIVEDSTDNTVHLAEKLKSDLEDFSFRIVICRSPNLGVGGARNIGLSFVNSEFLCFLDSDDFISEGSIKERINVFREFSPKNSNIIGSFSQTTLYFEDKQKYGGCQGRYKHGRLFKSLDAIANVPHISSILYSTERLNLPHFDMTQDYGEDWLYLVSCLLPKHCLVHSGKSTTYYSINQDSATFSSPEIHIFNLFNVSSRIAKMIASSDIEISGKVEDQYLKRSANTLARLLGVCLGKRNLKLFRRISSGVFEILSYPEKAEVFRLIEHSHLKHAATTKSEYDRFLYPPLDKSFINAFLLNSGLSLSLPRFCSDVISQLSS